MFSSQNGPDIHIYGNEECIKSQVLKSTMIELGLNYNTVPVRSEDNLYVWYEKINTDLSVPSLKYDQIIMTQNNDEIVSFLFK